MLWRVTNAWQASIRAALRPFDLTHVQFVLLAALTWLDAETPITQRGLAEYARTDAMMTSQVIRTLESKGVCRTTSTSDRCSCSLACRHAGGCGLGRQGEPRGGIFGPGILRRSGGIVRRPSSRCSARLIDGNNPQFRGGCSVVLCSSAYLASSPSSRDSSASSKLAPSISAARSRNRCARVRCG